MSTSSGIIYRSNVPPWPYFLRELEARGYDWASDLIRRYLPEKLWPEIFFGSPVALDLPVSKPQSAQTSSHARRRVE